MNICKAIPHTISEVIKMIENSELPIGFTMELARHSDILNQFAQLPKTEQNSVIEGARQKVRSKDLTIGGRYSSILPSSSV